MPQDLSPAEIALRERGIAAGNADLDRIIRDAVEYARNHDEDELMVGAYLAGKIDVTPIPAAKGLLMFSLLRHVMQEVRT